MNKSSYFQYNWIKYLFIIIVPLIFWIIIYSDIDQVQADECVKILYIGDSLEDEKLQEDIFSNINNITNQELKYVSIMSYSAEKELTYEYIRNRIYNVDIIIVSKEFYDEELLSQIFSPLTTMLKDEFSDSNFINFKDVSYGLKVSTDSTFNNYYSKNEEVSMFFSPYSLNIGKAYGYGKVENISAISIAKYILGGM
jgi:hypothetical protein